MSSGWGNDPAGSGSSQPPQAGYGDPTQPGYPPAPTQPGYPPAPTEPGYPAQPGYPPPAPGQPGYGDPMQPAYPAGPPPSRRPGWLGAAVVGIIAVLIVGGFFLFRDRLSNDITSLEPGQCFDKPANLDVEISEVQRQPCNEPHDAEVIASLTHPAPASEPYPVVSGFQDYIEQTCVPIFETYTGRSFQTAEDLSIGWIEPTLSGWGDGDRAFTCYAYRTDKAKLNATVRGAASSP